MKELFGYLKDLFRKKITIVPTIHTNLWDFEEETIEEYKDIIKRAECPIYFEADLSNPLLNQNILDVYLQQYARSLGKKLKFLDTEDTLRTVNNGISMLTQIPTTNESTVAFKREERKTCFWILREPELAKKKYEDAMKNFAIANKDFEVDITRANKMILERDQRWKKPNETCIVMCGLLHLDNF